MAPVFSDPTPRIERKDSLCTVVSVGAESTTHTGKTGVVSWKGRNYACTIIGTVAAGDKAHFVQTADGHVWAIKAGAYYRSAYPKRPEEWAKKAPVSLAILELMKDNPRDRAFQSGVIKSVGTNTATVSLRGKDISLPTKFEGVTVQIPNSSTGKRCLTHEDTVVLSKASGTLTIRIRLDLRGGFSTGCGWYYFPPNSPEFQNDLAVCYAYRDMLIALCAPETASGFWEKYTGTLSLEEAIVSLVDGVTGVDSYSYVAGSGSVSNDPHAVSGNAYLISTISVPFRILADFNVNVSGEVGDATGSKYETHYNWSVLESGLMEGTINPREFTTQKETTYQCVEIL